MEGKACQLQSSELMELLISHWSVTVCFFVSHILQREYCYLKTKRVLELEILSMELVFLINVCICICGIVMLCEARG